MVAGEGLNGPRKDVTPDMKTAAESLYRLSHLDFDRVLCYHGGLVEEGSDRVSEIFKELKDDLNGYRKSSGEGDRFLRRELETEDTGLSQFTVEAGESHGSKKGGNTAHRHTRQEEIYLFLDGSGWMKVDDEEFDVEEGDAVRVAPYAFRAVKVNKDLEFVAAGAPVKGDDTEVKEDFW